MTIPSVDELAELLGPEPVAEPVAARVNWLHQQKEFDEHRDDRFRVLLWSMRTGKSKAVIDKAEYQFGQGEIEGVVVLAPNGIHLNWIINEIPRWSWPENGEHMAFGWETPKRADFDRRARLDALLQHKAGLKWLTVNMEALTETAAGGMDCIKAIRAFKTACNGKLMLVISEAHHFGHAGAKRTRLARNLGRNSKFIVLETGTAILNSPLRAYSMFKIGDDLALGDQFPGDCYDKFARHFADFEMEERRGKGGRKRKFPKLKGYKNLDELRELMAQWSSVVLREDIGDMPELLETERLVVMSDLQRRAYLEMVSRHLVEIGDDMVAAKDGGARMMKLQQIVNGYLKDGDNIIDIDPNAPIYEALVDEVGGTLPGKSIVWCRFREDIRRCVAVLRRKGYQVLEFHGGTPLKDRDPVRLAFNNDPRYTVLVGQPAAGGEGRDFSGADAIIFFSSTPNAIHIQQAKERGTVIAGHAVAIVRMRTRGTVDDRNWDIVDGKVTLADTVSGRGLRDLLMRTDV